MSPYDTNSLFTVAIAVVAVALVVWWLVRRPDDDRATLGFLRLCEARHDARVAARTRASALLRNHLDETQRDEFERQGRFRLVAASGHRYRIKGSPTFNVRDETLGVDYCIHFRSDPDCWRIPIEDLMLAQKLLLECDEPAFLRIANKRAAVRENGSLG